MKEAIKGIVYRKHDVEIDGKVLQKYIVGLIVVTDEEMNLDDGDNVILYEGESIVSKLINKLPKYEPPCKLGRLTEGMSLLNCFDIDDLKEK